MTGLEVAKVRNWQIIALHSATFIAIKRPVATGRFWPLCRAMQTNSVYLSGHPNRIEAMN